jgi:hypothetical protein
METLDHALGDATQEKLENILTVVRDMLEKRPDRKQIDLSEIQKGYKADYKTDIAVEEVGALLKQVEEIKQFVTPKRLRIDAKYMSLMKGDAPDLPNGDANAVLD